MFFQWFLIYRNWGIFFFLQKKIFSMGGNGPKIWDLGVFSNFCTFFEWQKIKFILTIPSMSIVIWNLGHFGCFGGTQNDTSGAWIKMPKSQIWGPFPPIENIFFLQKKIFSHFLYIKNHWKNTGTFDFENFCNFQPYLLYMLENRNKTM